MDWVGTLCAVVGAGTISAGAMRLICWLDEGTKIDRTRRVRSEHQGRRSMRTSIVYTILA